jgi:hypothetical protein
MALPKYSYLITITNSDDKDLDETVDMVFEIVGFSHYNIVEGTHLHQEMDVDTDRMSPFDLGAYIGMLSQTLSVRHRTEPVKTSALLRLYKNKTKFHAMLRIIPYAPHERSLLHYMSQAVYAARLTNAWISFLWPGIRVAKHPAYDLITFQCDSVEYGSDI